MRHFFISILFSTIFSGALLSQSNWSKVFSEVKSAGQFSATEVIECPNGDLICAGGNGDKYGVATAFLMRLDPTGSQIWYKEYPGFHSFTCVIRLDSGGFVAGGLVNSGSAISSVLKIDSIGNVIQAVKVEVDFFGNVTSIVKSPNGFIATAAFAWELNETMTSTNWLARLQPNGGTSFISAAPGGFIVAGTGGLVSAYNDVHLTKIDSIGNPIWSMCYGGTKSERTMGVEPTIDGGFLVGGWTDSFDAWNRKYFLIKTDSIGNYEWGKTYNDSIYSNFGNCVLEDNAGNFYVGGVHQSADDQDNHVMVIKTNSFGDVIWSKTYNSGTAFSMIQTNDGNIVVAGETRAFEYFVFKMDTSGNSICSENVVIDEFDRSFQFQTSSSSGGITHTVDQVTISQQSYTKTNFSCEFLSTDEISGTNNESPIDVYPNPVSDFLQFKFAELSQNNSIEIYTIQGKLIELVNIEEGLKQKTLSVQGLSSGIYIYRFRDQNGILDQGRFVVDR